VFVASGDGYAASITTAAPLPHVTALADGGFVAAWDSYAGDQLGLANSDIFFQRFDASGNKVGAVTQANVESGGGHYDADVAALSDGTFLVAWQGADDDGNGVFGRRFGADGTAIDTQEFAISQLRSGDQASADVTALANGGFAGAWVDTSASGSAIEMRILAGGAGTLATIQSGTQTVTAGDATLGLGHLLAAVSGESKVSGLGGLDTLVYASARAGATIVNQGATVSVTDAAGNHATLSNVERVKFSDGMVALDVHGTAGEAYRLYQAAFDRTPDKAGLGYWIAAMDKGMTLTQAAAGFAGSAEFANLYGANASDTQFVQALYQNVLHRAGDGAGADFWLHALESSVTRADVLANFSESAENQAQVIGSIQNGIDYLHWG
jgi:hypothetical protein